ncbi:MAG: hypothetical protein ACYC61_15060 [Isosphaeraceae bacterium]
MALVAVIAVGLAVGRVIRREVAPTPAEWARSHAEMRARIERGSPTPLTRRYKELAERFEQRGTPWEEDTYNGPFTDALPRGTTMVTQQPTTAAPCWPDGALQVAATPWSMAEGGTCVVLSDDILDDDDCSPLREVLVRLLDGPHEGEIACVGRIDLRRKR